MMTFTQKARVDANQPQIVEDLRKAGFSVKPVHQLKGFCDIVVGYQGRNYLFEIKDPNQPPSKRVLTDDEFKFHSEWKGQVNVAMSADDIIYIINHSKVR